MEVLEDPFVGFTELDGIGALKERTSFFPLIFNFYPPLNLAQHLSFVTFPDVYEELTVLHWQQLISAREIAFPDARSYSTEPEPALVASLKHVRSIHRESEPTESNVDSTTSFFSA